MIGQEIAREHCKCEGYAKTVPILNSLIATNELIRNGGEYQGHWFKYCAWCGIELEPLKK